MFGYVYIDKPNIRIKDFAEFKAYYCGVCKELGRRYTQLHRFTVNYDVAFLNMLAHAVLNRTPSFKEERCVAHPVGRKFSVVEKDEIQTRIAHINVILGYYKVADDVLDEGGALKKSLLCALRPAKKRAAKALPRFEHAVEKGYRKLREREKAGGSADELASLFGEMMVEIAFAAVGEMNETLKRLSSWLGRYVYCLDAADDLEKDLKKGGFNPYIPKENMDAAALEYAYERARFDVDTAIREVIAAYDEMKIETAEGPLSNTIYLGLNARAEGVFARRTKKNDKQPV